MFWAFSLCLADEVVEFQDEYLFRCSMFWAFSLCIELYKQKRFWKNVSMLNVLSFFFIKNLTRIRKPRQVSMLNVLSFFFIMERMSTMEIKVYLFRCSMFWAFSLSEVKFFINPFDWGFDAQCFELFLYKNSRSHSWGGRWSVSMLNVLSFFFIRTTFNL